MSSLVYMTAKSRAEALELARILAGRKLCLPAFMEAAKLLHSYQVPCIVALPVAGGNLPFLEWIENNSRGEAPCG